MDPDRTAKTRLVWPTLQVEISRRKSGHEETFSSCSAFTAHGSLFRFSFLYGSSVTKCAKKHKCGLRKYSAIQQLHYGMSVLLASSVGRFPHFSDFASDSVPHCSICSFLFRRRSSAKNINERFMVRWASNHVTTTDVVDYFRFVTLVDACAQPLWRIPEVRQRWETSSSTNAWQCVYKMSFHSA